MFINLWSPGATENNTGDKIYLLNGIFDFTQCVVSSVTDNVESVALVHIFMSDIVMNFSMFLVVVIDDGSTFKGGLF